MNDLEAGDAAAVRAAVSVARAGLVEREALAEVVALCAVAREHLLVIGAPGTAKSEAVRREARALGGGYFEYLLDRFTEPNEIFRPVDLRRLRDGIVEVETAGMLPEAEIDGYAAADVGEPLAGVRARLVAAVAGSGGTR